MRRLFPLGFALAACTGSPASPPSPSPTPSATTSTSTEAEAGRAPYAEVLGLMRLDPQDLTRAKRLHPLLVPLCSDAGARRNFLAAAREASLAPSAGGAERLYALDILEYTAVLCSAADPVEAQAFLAEARRRFADEPRLPLVAARIFAADARYDDAAREAAAARAAGSNGAVALLATIQAARAKAAGVGYRPGQLDEALATVSVDPDGSWRLIDLMALLQTRAQLLSERAVWEDPPERTRTATLARQVYARLAAPPFIEITRQYALDRLCFEAADGGAPAGDDSCARAAREHGNLGAAFLAGVGLDPARFDLDRVRAIQAVEERVAAMPAGALVLLIARGDEPELIAWARPASVVLARVMDRRPTLVVLDRSTGARAGAVVDRMVALAGARPALRIDAERDPLAAGCVAAIAAGRTTPRGCPLAPEAIAQLAARKTFGLGLLVGRDLDAEIDDLELYELPEVLLSIRQPATEKKVDAHLKSVSDSWLLGRAAARRAGSQTSRARPR